MGAAQSQAHIAPVPWRDFCRQTATAPAKNWISKRKLTLKWEGMEAVSAVGGESGIAPFNVNNPSYELNHTDGMDVCGM